MKKCFEDEFVDVQSGLISLCLELTEEVVGVDKVYAFAHNERKSKSFNAFFGVNGEVKTMGKMNELSHELITEFLRIGTDDLEKIEKICDRYERPVPVIMEMIYDVKTGGFDAHYQYEPLPEDVCSDEIFLDWISEMKNKKK